MTVRPAVPDDAPAILTIAYEQRLPPAWRLPTDKHILVAESGGPAIAFACVYESAYGLVVDELWELPTPEGYRALALLRRHLEGLAQGLADRRGVPLQCGGIVRLDRERHILALKRRGYTVEAEVLAKTFTPADPG